jgi:hypothetical protein
MKKTLLILLCFPVIGFGQFMDSFSDGDFTNNPNWLGDVGIFEVDTSFNLHLNDSIANFSSLVTQSQSIINGEWIFSVRLNFSPSTNNYARVYLISDEQDLSGNLNGYFVKIGGQIGNVDDFSLYSQNGTNQTKIIDGIDTLASNNPDIRLKVTRDTFGNWELFLDTNGVFFTQGTAFDNDITSSYYFGVFCKYTITRSDKFWFDDFSVNGSPAVYGCTDFMACNYNALATADNGLCDLPNGCGDQLYVEYAPSVTCSDPLDCITLITTGSFNITNTKKTLFKITDMLAREIPYRRNTSLFYIYDDGTVEKRIVIE